MKKVQVLLSAYNGEKFLVEQLDSLLNQEYPNLSILVRDDGSKDRTLEILSQYKAQNANFSYIMGENVGVKNSFFELMEKADGQSDYFAFCDQDDVWEPQKISRMVEVFESQQDKELPLLYFSRLKLVDQELNVLRETLDLPRAATYENALIQNVVTGCSMGIDNHLRLLALQNKPNSAEIIMHDAWLYLVASAFGKCLFDHQAHILYRQHSSNVVGIPSNKFQSLKVRYHFFKKDRTEKPYTRQNKEFYRLYQNELSQEKSDLLKKFLFSRNHFLKKVAFIFHNPLYRQQSRDTLIFRISYLNNWY